MISVTPSLVVRSSLEEMLDSLQRKEDIKKPTDLPPALPARPASKARLPKRPVPAMFGVGDVVLPEVGDIRRQDFKGGGGGGGSFGRKKVLETAVGESPYTMAAVHEHRLAENGGAHLATPPPPPPSLYSGWDNSIDYFIKKQLRVWCLLQNGQWELGKIQSASGGKASVTLLDGTVMVVSTGELLPANMEILDGVDNLVGLGYLNEPSVLCNLQYRYARDVIYTMAGPVLLAINPFKDVSISGSDVITAYREKILDSPHVYAVAEAAYSDMRRDGVNHSIIISGESGSGKSVTANLAIQYLVGAGGENSEIASKIRQTGCILEAFGNAKTSRNRSSSRFGKLIDIHYNAKGIVYGAYIHTLLLEKSRISQLGCSERSYHIFYQMCAGAPSDMRDKLNLRMASEYKFLSRSGCLKIHGVDDAQNFKKLMEALDALQISYEDQERMFKLLAAVLWLGNISFEIIDEENHVEVMIDEASRSAARLMGCKVKDLMLALSTNRNQSDMPQNFTLPQAIDTRDALAKFVYTSLFSWVVEAINRSLEGDKEHMGRSISILDTYGFESFQKNSLEQLLINYADERLHQHFIRHLFKLEQEEYESEGIDWKKVEFIDNQECLNLFEKKTVGIISILDEASNTSECTDLIFANKVRQNSSSYLSFNGERGAFRVRHYAGEVRYETNGFLEKNRDILQSDNIRFLLSCCDNFGSSESDLDKQTVGTKFKGQLFKMIQQLENSKPHFIRCIRPNAKQLHGMYEKDIVLQQLRCGGVLETVRISKSRYPTCMTHQEFATRFGCLLSENTLCQDPLSISVAILQQYHVLPEMYQLGYTKLYFRAEQVGVLEKRRQEVMQGTYKAENGCSVHRDFHELMSGIVTLQSFVRGENSRRGCNVLKKSSHQIAPRSPDEHLTAAVHIQSVIRGWLARRNFNHLQSWKSSADSPKTRQKSRSLVSEVKNMSQENIQILPSNVEELQKLVMKAEVSLSQREQENSALREQVRQFEVRWSEHEIKMKSVEETWQRQMASLQKSLGAAKKSLGADDDDSEDNTPKSQNPDGNTNVESGNNSSTVDELAKELERKKRNFEDDAKAIVEVKSGNMPYSKQMEEFKRVKQRFDTWKKEYKNRLRETRAKLGKGVNGEGGGSEKRARQSWWGKLSKRI
ncbi:myosin-2-like [Cynara cardunculus var. scolymus]|uniref:myosin-2-like n=1 Tax=Cynara cardunculus var. scolymus TaxID=59895 RepID=UPI000D6256C2|nr:myosin-2-like [Cynara cardunculus var. scolymus]